MEIEAVGENTPLALRRFQECWQRNNSVTAARHATQTVLENYRQMFPGVSMVIRVSRLCEMLKVRLSGIRPANQKKTFHAITDSPIHHTGHSGTVRFSRKDVPYIEIPDGIDGYRARISAAHEIGHVLIHRRGENYDDVTTRLPGTPQEEAIAEYIARLLLLPLIDAKSSNLAEYAVRLASDGEVTVHAATCRLGDPDQCFEVKGAVLWKLNSRVQSHLPIYERLTPAWHLCPDSFVPVGRCKARAGSLIAELANQSTFISDARMEDVRIGSFAGNFKVHAFAWGSISNGTRLVLSIFQGLSENQDNVRSTLKPSQSIQQCDNELAANLASRL